MKYVIVLGDGMADEPLAELHGQTPLAYAKTENLDALSAVSEIGMVHTIPDGMKPGSDTANLSVMGYDPRVYYSGRSPLEALSIGVPMKETDIALRCNLVTLSEEEALTFAEQTILDHSADEIGTEEAAVLLQAVQQELENETWHFYVGTSYRHCLIWEQGQVVELTQPHDIPGQVIGAHLPQDTTLREMMQRSYEILKHHPLNEERRRRGLRPANCCWFWGAGTKPLLSNFQEAHQKKGVMISAVDLLKGIAVGAGMDTICVEGANGGLHTNYEGKAAAAVKALTEDGYDFAYIHIEAPDEMGHQGSVEKKIQAIENIDKRVIKSLKEGLDRSGEPYRLLVLPDHPTPIRVRTHTSDDVPYLLYDSTNVAGAAQSGANESHPHYNEKEASATGIRVEKGHELIRKLFANR